MLILLQRIDGIGLPMLFFLLLYLSIIFLLILILALDHAPARGLGNVGFMFQFIKERLYLFSQFVVVSVFGVVGVAVFDHQLNVFIELLL